MAEQSTGSGKKVGGNDKPIPGPSIDPRTLDGSSGGNSGGGDDGGIRDASGEQFDPDRHVSPDKRNADGSFTRKRGRRKGQGGSYRKAKISHDLGAAVDSLAKTLVVCHVGLASAFNAAELVISEDEGKTLANAIANVMAEFDLRPDPRTQAILGLIFAAGTVYGPRVYLIRRRKAQEAKEKAANGGSGTGGIYDANGNPLGTTEFSVADKPN